MRSPDGNHELRRLEGNPDDIDDRGRAWVALGTQMEKTADELTAIGDSSVHKSKGTDKLAELATETAGDLKAASVRYSDTGEVLKSYAIALQTAQNWIHPRIDDIESAENTYQNALDAKAEAQSGVDDLDRTWVWEEEPTDAQRSSAGEALSDASTALNSAEGTRDDLWERFDTVFETWSDAYDDAVNGIQKAMDTAGNNDGFWEFVDDVLAVVGYVLLVLSIIALIIGAPLTGLLGLIILGLTVLALGLTLLKFAYGKATLSDVAWAAVGLLPFGIGKLLSRGAPVLAAVIRSGRGIATTAIRAGLPRVSLLRPTTWVTPVRSLFAPLTARLALPNPGMFVNPLKSITMGGTEAVQVQNFLTTMRTSPWASNPAVQQFISTTTGALPGAGQRLLNTGLWGGFTGGDVAGVLGVQPPIPGLRDIQLSP
ncbi:hypothetical protein J7E25_16570 [Agromyces sp. ISL-38]|uniref:hypothetical protein n=1 Tax=Agromyces sp. ISL-38 TaxID=2819107 RepID=UPI001BE77249|nr:hypothetical protein [Agromyces sp. ISL-38]MBT2500711.1 hypothetical protein [Agromyces sp. ISL-38]MBT2516692.1 hypothetical protein [Streptomyces sp. ISL-90]